MRPLLFLSALLLSTVLLAACQGRGSGDPASEKARLRTMHDEAIARLELEHADRDLRERIARSAGHAVFRQIEATLLLANGASGSGLAVDRQGKETFMRLAGGGVGLGLGATDDRLLLIFRSHAAYDRFVTSGWEASTKADATATTSDRGGEANATGSSQDVEVYRLTDGGAALRATVSGIRYWPADDLNR